MEKSDNKKQILANLDNYKKIFIVTCDNDSEETCIRAYVKWETELLPWESYVITKGFDGCIFLFTDKEYDRFCRSLKRLSDKEKYNRQLCRFFMASAEEVEMDGEGRLLYFHSHFVDYANIKDEVIVVGKGEVAQIWGKNTLLQNPNEIEEVWKKYEEIIQL